jgi:hypothetical protein
MTLPPIDIVAKVECRSENRGEERPIAIWFADQRLEIVDVIDRAMVTSIEAGEPVRHRLWVELEDGKRCELTRVEPDGTWRVRIDR